MKLRLYILFTITFFISLRAIASHIVGGEVTYVYKSTADNANNYEVSITIYEDCLNGDPTAIAQDNPAYVVVFDGDGNFIRFDSLYANTVLIPTNFSNSCITNYPQTCLQKRTFTNNYSLPQNTTGYYVAYQRCCRNASIRNILNPGSTGATYFCTIPAKPLINNSAVFKNYPPQIICNNNPLVYDNSATDADGDSLSYGFCESYTGGSDNDAKPIAGPPPYTQVQYVPGFSSGDPISSVPTIQIDPTTGLITGTPVQVGRYLVTVCCYEWRYNPATKKMENINIMKREFQFVVTDCSKKVVADIPQYSTDYNTYVVDCKNYTVNFTNTSTGGFTYHWDFGLKSDPADTSNAFQPSFTYPDTGVYVVKLLVNPGSTCPDSITRFVKVFPYFHADFSDSGLPCPLSPIYFTDLSSATIKPVTTWQWNFGDGDSTTAKNPVHSYANGGNYNVTLISGNIKDCIDTAVKQVVIQNFMPFAGDDTIIVRGQSILFNATGGIDYTWSPPTNLSDTSIYNPVGYFPDTGHFKYSVFIVSSFGCSGSDSMTVWVVNQASFFVPNAFTPNGDGKNDIFKPIAVGYKELSYFRVFNRWGEEVFFTTSFEVGWDGTYLGEKAQPGVYFWEMGFVDKSGKAGFLKGDVTLIR